MTEPIPHWQRIENAYQASRDACAALTQAIKDKKSKDTLETLRRSWGQKYDEYAKIRDSRP